MAIEIMSEVWSQSPKDVKGVKLLVLLRLANSATLETRMTCISVKRLAEECHCSERAVYDALSWLDDRGIIQQVADEDVPRAFRPYGTLTRRVTPVTEWDEACPAGVYSTAVVGDPETPDFENSAPPEGANSAPTRADFSSPNPDNSDESDILTETRMHPRLNNLPLKVRNSLIGSTSYSSARSSSVRKGMIIRGAGSDDPGDLNDLDPSKIDNEDEEREGHTPGTGTRPRRQVNPDTGMGLANYFVDAVFRAGGWGGMDFANKKILAGKFNQWKRNGTGPDQIRAMIKIYAEDESLRDDSRIPWVDFLRKRGLLASRTAGEGRVALVESQRARDEEIGAQRGSESRRRSARPTFQDYLKEIS